MCPKMFFFRQRPLSFLLVFPQWFFKVVIRHIFYILFKVRQFYAFRINRINGSIEDQVGRNCRNSFSSHRKGHGRERHCDWKNDGKEAEVFLLFEKNQCGKLWDNFLGTGKHQRRCELNIHVSKLNQAQYGRNCIYLGAVFRSRGLSTFKRIAKMGFAYG